MWTPLWMPEVSRHWAIFIRDRGLSVAVFRLDLATGARRPVLTYHPGDASGPVNTRGIYTTPDARIKVEKGEYFCLIGVDEAEPVVTHTVWIRLNAQCMPTLFIDIMNRAQGEGRPFNTWGNSLSPRGHRDFKP